MYYSLEVTCTTLFTNKLEGFDVIHWSVCAAPLQVKQT